MILPLLRSNGLTEAGFLHGFTTRVGGVSLPPYDALDFALLREPVALRENQRRVAEAVGFHRGVLHQTMQVHGARAITATGDPKTMVSEEADALIADPGTGHAVAVRVADCVPVLIGDRRSGSVAAVHAGWRGIEAGVIAAAVKHLSSGEARGGDLVAAMGPCIGVCCFEVGRDVADRIARASAPEVVRASGASGADEKAFVDLRLAARIQLRTLGLGDDAIDDVPAPPAIGCTRCDAKRFYSYRRDGDASGRLLAVIVAR